MIIGFTGAQEGMTPAQRSTVYALMRAFDATPRATAIDHSGRHGDCIGADAEFHDLCEILSWMTISHPCNIESKRAHKKTHRTHDVKPPLDRNHDIAELSDVVIAAPKEYEEQLRSGTWSTVRYAVKAKVPVFVTRPDGLIEVR